MQDVNSKQIISIKSNLEKLYTRIGNSCTKARRSLKEILLVAVTKTVSVENIFAGIDAGIKVIGENRVQEALEKYSVIGNEARPAPFDKESSDNQNIQKSNITDLDKKCGVQWHLVGHLQTNKVKKALEIFTMIQSIDSLHLAQEIERRAIAIQKHIHILIEVNTSQEETKFGVKPSQLIDLVKDILNLSHLKLSGLMTIGPGLAIEDKEKSRPCFRMLYDLKQKVETEFGIKLPYLSMGMSSDFEVGIEEGSNMIRVGTAIFGARV